MKPISILHVEDDSEDAAMALRQCKSNGLEVMIRRVEDEASYRQALQQGGFRLILSDYSLPDFDGARALAIAKQLRPDLPFLFLSGSMGEELAVESLKQGAVDYVLKSFMPRLPSAITRALAESEVRQEKERAERELRLSETLLRSLIESSGDSIWSVDRRLHLLSSNAAARKLFKSNFGTEIKTGACMDEWAVSEGFHRKLRPALERAIAGERHFLESEVKALTGEVRHLETSFNPVETAEGVIGAVVFTRDMTERNSAHQQILRQRDELEAMNAQLMENQAQLIQSEKMASLGQLSAGVGHEINNPMAYITANLATLSECAPKIMEWQRLGMEIVRAKNSPLPAMAACIEALENFQNENGIEEIIADLGALVSESLEGTRRVNEIVAGLKAVSRADAPQSQPVSVQECLQDALKVAWNTLKHKGEIHTDFAEVPLVLGHPGQLKQVFLNLLINAGQAIQDKGVVCLRIFTEKSKVVAEVQDDGSGIPPEHLPKMFKAFFTTKPVGQGTGLGLSISYGIIQSHGGEMTVRSEPGKGATFRVCLPIPQEVGAEK